MVDELHVLASARGRGVRGRLLAHSETLVEARRSTLSLDTNVTNPARRLYATFERPTGVTGRILYVKPSRRALI